LKFDFVKSLKKVRVEIFVNNKSYEHKHEMMNNIFIERVYYLEIYLVLKQILFLS